MSLRPFGLPLVALATIVMLAGCGDSSSLTGAETSLDTTPPPAPQDLALDSDSRGNPIMTWTHSAAPDVAGYQVYEYRAVPGGYDYVATGDVTVDNSFGLPTVSTTVEVSYRVRAVDVAGNWSTYSATASIPIPARTPSGTHEIE